MSTGTSAQEVFRLGTLVLDVARHEVTILGELVPLTLREFRLLHRLLEVRGAVISRQELLAILRAGSQATIRAVDVHIARLRRKLGGARAVIQTVRGHGYRIAHRG